MSPGCVQNRIKTHGAQIFDRRLPFDELTTVESALAYFKKQMRTNDITVETIDVALAKAKELGAAASAQGYETRVIEAAEPGDPRSGLHTRHLPLQLTTASLNHSDLLQPLKEFKKYVSTVRKLYAVSYPAVSDAAMQIISNNMRIMLMLDVTAGALMLR